jgi:hypothetical protein
MAGTPLWDNDLQGYNIAVRTTDARLRCEMIKLQVPEKSEIPSSKSSGLPVNFSINPILLRSRFILPLCPPSGAVIA